MEEETESQVAGKGARRVGNRATEISYRLSGVFLTDEVGEKEKRKDHFFCVLPSPPCFIPRKAEVRRRSRGVEKRRRRRHGRVRLRSLTRPKAREKDKDQVPRDSRRTDSEKKKQRRRFPRSGEDRERLCRPAADMSSKKEGREEKIDRKKERRRKLKGVLFVARAARKERVGFDRSNDEREENSNRRTRREKPSIKYS